MYRSHEDIGMSSTDDPILGSPQNRKAADNRDALARALYGIVFNFIVDPSAGHNSEVGPKKPLISGNEIIPVIGVK